MFKLPHNCTHLTHLQSNAQNSTSQASIVCEPRKLPDAQTGFRKGRGTRDQIINIHWIIEKARKFQKNIYFCFTDYTEAFVWITTNCGKFFKRWEYQTTLPASWEIGMQVKKQQLEPDMEQGTGSELERSMSRLYIITLNWERSTSWLYIVTCYFTYAEYIMWNSRLDEAQAGIKIARRNIRNLRYADDTTFMAESKEELKSLLVKV